MSVKNFKVASILQKGGKKYLYTGEILIQGKKYFPCAFIYSVFSEGFMNSCPGKTCYLILGSLRER